MSGTLTGRGKKQTPLERAGHEEQEAEIREQAAVKGAKATLELPPAEATGESGN